MPVRRTGEDCHKQIPGPTRSLVRMEQMGKRKRSIMQNFESSAPSEQTAGHWKDSCARVVGECYLNSPKTLGQNFKPRLFLSALYMGTFRIYTFTLPNSEVLKQPWQVECPQPYAERRDLLLFSSFCYIQVTCLRSADRLQPLHNTHNITQLLVLWVPGLFTSGKVAGAWPWPPITI